MECRLGGQESSFSAGPADDEDAYMPENYLSSEEDPVAKLEADDWNGRVEHRMRTALARLDDRARDILQRRWLTEDNKAGLQELGNEYGVSAERIRQIESAAMKKLRKAIETEAA